MGCNTTHEVAAVQEAIDDGAAGAASESYDEYERKSHC